MPTAPLQTAGPFIGSHWNARTSTDLPALSFIRDPLDDSDGGTIVQMEYPKGSYSGTDMGGVGNLQLGVFAPGQDRAIMSYEVGFSRGFDFVKGGKLPGLFGGDVDAHCTGGKNSEACFSLRLMWREQGAGEIYAYIPTYLGFCSEGPGPDEVFCHSDGFGASIHRGSFTFKAGSWNQVTQVVVLNYPPETANGYLALYFEGELAMELKNVVFRTNESVTVSSLIFSTFFGGSSSDYAATSDCDSYFRNFRFWQGSAANSAPGPTVQASYG
ncbi:hypothetical protein JCM8202_003190 [Rhodotorula sphaerocarpa]